MLAMNSEDRFHAGIEDYATWRARKDAEKGAAAPKKKAKGRKAPEATRLARNGHVFKRTSCTCLPDQAGVDALFAKLLATNLPRGSSLTLALRCPTCNAPSISVRPLERVEMLGNEG
jgi:hypothetical protein